MALIDVITGLQAHGAILAALLERSRTGVGQRVDCSLLESQVRVTSKSQPAEVATDNLHALLLQIASLINVASAALNAGQEPARWGSAHASIVPYQVCIQDVAVAACECVFIIEHHPLALSSHALPPGIQVCRW